MSKILIQKSLILGAFLVGTVSVVYILSKSTLEAESSSSASSKKHSVSQNMVSDKSSSHRFDQQPRSKVEVQAPQKAISKSADGSTVVTRTSPQTSGIKKFRPVAKDFKDEIRKLEETKTTLQLERTLSDGTVVIDTVEAHTSSTVVLLTEEGEPIQGHGGLILNAPEIDTENSQ